MDKPGLIKKNLRVTSLIAASLLLFFLIELMPHRVHHMFDQDAAQDCVTFNVSKGCTLGAGAAVDISIVATANPLSPISVGTRISHLSPSPFLQRAPPPLV